MRLTMTAAVVALALACGSSEDDTRPVGLPRGAQPDGSVGDWLPLGCVPLEGDPNIDPWGPNAHMRWDVPARPDARCASGELMYVPCAGGWTCNPSDDAPYPAPCEYCEWCAQTACR
jgi:hypothetical protein